MTTGGIIFLTCTIIAFTAFAVVLAWGAHQTRHLN